MTLLVTGATGHVGGEIVRQAAQRGMPVIATYRGELRADERRIHRSNGCAAISPMPTPCAVSHRSNRIDACIHAAAVSNEAYAKPDPAGAIATNIGATANLLDAARLASWRRFVLVSTGSVFQLVRDATQPILEDQAPAAANVYSTTKLGAEMLTRMYRTEYGLSAATVRISWVFGPPIISDQPMRGPIPSYLLRALQGDRDPRGRRGFCRELHVCGRCRRGSARRSHRAGVAPPDLSSRPWRQFHRRSRPPPPCAARCRAR